MDPEAQDPAAPADPTGDLGTEDRVMGEIKRALNEIEFGSIVIKIHQGRVVGMETSTKLRL